MMLVRVLKYWKYPDLFRQTPGNKGIWNGIQFVIDEPGEADYVVLHGHAEKPAWVKCPKGHIWLVMGEAPHEFSASWHDIPSTIDRAYMTDAAQVDEKHILSTSYLPWWVDKDYDSLTACTPCRKDKPLSWITSNNNTVTGHRYRLRFLDKVRGMEKLDLCGRGFTPIADKWDALAPYRYTIAFENYSNSHYWSEKVMDAFLAWTMPIYYGCTQLDKFFPRDSFIQLDPEIADPVAFLQDVISSDARERNLDAIAEARNRVLNDYNLFNLIAQEIEANEHQYETRKPRKHLRPVLDHTAGRSQVLPEFLRPASRLLRPLLHGIRK
jgi:hypothetical protein